uniref:Seven TM Receptor n=1 Tax=Caenorhabditis japonica TaxID=281687 RepID=A0A8R1DUG8_CAEJA
MYCGCFGASMAIFGIHFIYRYLVASGSKFLNTFSKWKITFWFLIPIVYGATWGWLAYNPVGHKPATGEYIRNNILETFDLRVEDAIWIGPYFYQKQTNNTFKIEKESIIAMSVVYLIVFSSFFTIIYFGVKCYSIISNLAPSTKTFRSRRLQSLLFWALVTQTIIPVVLMHVPVFLVYAFALLDKDIGMLSGFVSMTIAAYPAIDPLPTILIIPHYRNAIIRKFYSFSDSLKFSVSSSILGSRDYFLDL